MEFDELIDDVINMSAGLFNDDDDEIIIGLMTSDQQSGARGSQPGRSPNINRNFREGHQRLMNDYFNDNATYSEKHFLRRFRMPKSMFMQIMSDLESHDDFFKWRCDAAGKIGLSPVQKCTAALRMLAYGASAGSLDENVRIGESTALLTLRKFCTGIIELYGPEYLRPPTADEVNKLMAENAKRGFPGMVASIDCMHWAWKNCPVALKGQYQGKEGKPTIVLEACASYDTYVWHCFFGCPGSCNDINVLDRSPLINDIVQHDFLAGAWNLADKQHTRGYLLADGIYPDWTIFMKTISQPQTAKEKHYAKVQESLRKDVERAFGILQACWHILVHPCRLWDAETMKNAIMTCIILHNMRIRCRSSHAELESDIENLCQESSQRNAGFERTRRERTFAEACKDRIDIRNPLMHIEMRNDLIDHLWMTRGDRVE